ncbi:QsdR family transcriptional regulator [Nocardia sp. NPDC050712]|uniref:QsdR family transcriptional regulator n=1 Tax=Nocardia sp. NPDC050712 TaxID=3155518 RepID=UPI0033C732A5
MRASTEEIVQFAAGLIVDGVRLDTRELALRFEMSRTTLFRRVGNREELMGKALWWLADRALERAVARWDEQYGQALHDERDVLRCLRILEFYGEVAVNDAGFVGLLENEPVVAMRVLTDPHGQVQPRVVAAHVALFERDAADGGFVPLVDLPTLGYAAVRLQEAILYSDVLTGHTANFPTAVLLVRKLVEGVLRGPSGDIARSTLV